MSWGPLSLANQSAGSLAGKTLGNYSLALNSPAIDYVPVGTTSGGIPSTDFFGNPRPDPAVPNRFDVGAVEFQGRDTVAAAAVTGGPLNFGSVPTGTTSAAKTLTLTNYGGAGITGITVAVTAPFSRSGGTCTTTLAAGASCTINVVFAPTVAATASGTATITSSIVVNGSPVALSGTGITPLVSAVWSPGSHNFGTARRGVGALTAPTQVFTLTNNGKRKSDWYRPGHAHGR